MNRSISPLLVVILTIFILLSCHVDGKGVISRTMLWNLSNLDQIKNDYAFNSTYNSLIKVADDYCVKTPVVVTEKQKTFASDKHFFCSMGTYWWPDPDNPGQYINKDGISNPECNLYDRTSLNEMTRRCQYLSVAFYLTKGERYFDAFVKQIRAWFINKDTYMYPTFEYAQVIPGRNNNKGRSTGFIGAYSFNSIIESIRLVNSVQEIDRKTMKSLQKWFLSFAEWADFGEFSHKLHEGTNNIGVAYDVTLINMYLFVGKERRAKIIADAFEADRLSVQIEVDGRQPEELKRTKAFSYSLANLSYMIDYCYLNRYWYPNYYIQRGQRIENAYEYLKQYIGKRENFPYQQISDWDKCELLFHRLEYRRNKLLRNNNTKPLTITGIEGRFILEDILGM